MGLCVPHACSLDLLPSSGLWWENSFCTAANAYVHVWFFCSVIGLPGEEDWPRDVALPRQAFHSKSPQPIENFVTDIDEQGKDLLLVSSGDAVICPLWGWGQHPFSSTCRSRTRRRPRAPCCCHCHTCSSWRLWIPECLQFL